MASENQLDALQVLPEAARARALALIGDMASWAGELQGVDAREDAEGWHVTLRFAGGLAEFVTPAGAAPSRES